MPSSSFLPQRGNFKNLIAYQKAECIYDITFMFVNKYLSKGDRTIDQMVQAARSGKQNIAEGSAASTTSRETEIKLYNVARASLQELLVDYEDYLRVRNLALWPLTDTRSIRARKGCTAHTDSQFYRDTMQDCSAETFCNIAITLIHQTDVFLRKLIESVKNEFIQEGGIREQMTRARLDYRNKPKI